MDSFLINIKNVCVNNTTEMLSCDFTSVTQKCYYMLKKNRPKECVLLCVCNYRHDLYLAILSRI